MSSSIRMEEPGAVSSSQHISAVRLSQIKPRWWKVDIMLYFAVPILGATALAVIIPFLIVFFQHRDDEPESDEVDR
jgi:hypothetical protein